jgi:succinylarginine dihydrolase
MTTTEPRVETHLSFRTERIAKQRARVWANLNDVVREDREVEVGEVFEVRIWNGSGIVPAWLRYDVTNDGEGNHVITSTRYSTDPEA